MRIVEKFCSISCPYCGYEYLPQEIFIPRAVFGCQDIPRIIRDKEGKIRYYVGAEQDFTEKFTCNNCGNTFNVNLNLTYKATKETTDEFILKRKTE